MTYPPCNLLIPDWYRGSIQADQNSDTLANRFIKHSEFLSIEKVNQSHAGSYFVTMENDIGTKQNEFKFEVIKSSSNTEIIVAVGVAGFVVIAIVVVMAVRHVHNSRHTDKGELFSFIFCRTNIKLIRTADTDAKQHTVDS